MDAAPPLQIQLLSTKGKAPTRGSAFAAGYDLYSAEDTTVPGRGKAMVSTGIAIAVPAGTCESLPKFPHVPSIDSSILQLL
jgi:dUTP pyrophosphatase